MPYFDDKARPGTRRLCALQMFHLIDIQFCYVCDESFSGSNNVNSNFFVQLLTVLLDNYQSFFTN